MEISTVHLPARWQLVLSIARKDIVTILHHPYHLISLLMPLFVSLVFLVLLPTLSGNDTIRVLVYDAGSSQLPDRLALLENVAVERVESETAVLEQLKGDVVAGVVLPQGFDTAVAIMLTTLFMLGVGLLLGLMMHNNQGKAAALASCMVGIYLILAWCLRQSALGNR